jgi:hypothetical protein
MTDLGSISLNFPIVSSVNRVTELCICVFQVVFASKFSYHFILFVFCGGIREITRNGINLRIVTQVPLHLLAVAVVALGAICWT